VRCGTDWLAELGRLIRVTEGQYQSYPAPHRSAYSWTEKVRVFRAEGNDEQAKAAAGMAQRWLRWIQVLEPESRHVARD